jgi:hypothetical protein
LNPVDPQSSDSEAPFVDVVELNPQGDVVSIFSLGSCGSSPIELEKKAGGHWTAICEDTIGPVAWGAGSSNWIRLQTGETEEFIRLQFPTDDCNPFIDVNCSFPIR